MTERIAITVGSFDGVHVGHTALVRAARHAVGPAEQGGRIVALAFFPHPFSTLRPEAVPARLTNWEQRREQLSAAGADEVVRLPPTPELLALTPQAFVERMVTAHRPNIWIEGPDFRFGCARAGDGSTLERFGLECGFETIIVPEQEVALHDLTLAPASSSLARWLLQRGRIADARCVLGRHYEIRGRVEPGDQRGRRIGVPTANIATESMPPGDGVYTGFSQLSDGRMFPAALSVGSKPTFGEHDRTVEAHLIGWDGRIDGEQADYGWPMRITFLTWLREQIRYDHLDDMLAQIHRDIDCTFAANLRGEHATNSAVGATA